MLARATALLPGGALLQDDDDSFDGIASTTAIDPIYTTFPLSVSLTTTRAASFLHVFAYIAWNFTGTPPAALRTANFRFSRNGVLLPASRAASCTTIRGAITTVSYSRLLIATPGVHTITFEWAKKTGSGTLIVNTTGVVLPDVFGANLAVEEYAL